MEDDGIAFDGEESADAGAVAVASSVTKGPLFI
jgi:hypothetical protein